MSVRRAFACVLGGPDLLRAAAMAAIPCVLVSAPGAPARWSRHTRRSLTWHNGCSHPEALLNELLGFARTAEEPPVLFYQGDADALFISRFRSQLASCFRFVIPSPQLVEDLIDKDRFARLARALELPVPISVTLTPDSPPGRGMPVEFPAVVKPVARQLSTWNPMGGQAKALRVDSFDDLTAIWRQAAEHGTHLMVQQLVPGDESRVESYHVYVDDSGAVAAEFTGRKVRTFPARFGQSTALEISDAPDVRELGGDLVRRMGLRGVAKLDFKRDPQGRLFLLEVNPRFNLWHHLGAVAGVNIPAVVYADLTGTQRPSVAQATVGAGWSKPLQDLKAVRACGASLGQWLRWTISAKARSGLHVDDPLLVLGWALGRLWKTRRKAEPARPAEAPACAA